MADLVAPFQGERYAAADRLSVLIAPPYDVIDPAERARYAALDRDNIVHIMLPEAPPGAPEEERYRVAAERLAAWRRTGVLGRDPKPVLYVLAQDFTLPTGERRTRRGVFAAVAAEGYEPRRIRPHEHTHAGPKADRLALMRATATNIESIFLLAPDHDRALANAVAAASSARPDATAELNGVGIRLWIVRDPSRFPLSASPLYIADADRPLRFGRRRGTRHGPARWCGRGGTAQSHQGGAGVCRGGRRRRDAAEIHLLHSEGAERSNLAAPVVAPRSGPCRTAAGRRACARR